ncbi:MAG: phosphatase PAP2 family protein [Muribaculaceae bacterium]|nr:phosphatase PAP2 family protein [Muribaculaceae bacterium]
MKTLLLIVATLAISACGHTLGAQDVASLIQNPDTVAVIIDPQLTPDEVYDDSVVIISPQRETTTFIHEDHTHDFHWEQFAIPAGLATASALFVKTPKLVQAREWVQSQLANKTGQPRTEVDDYIQYAPMLASYAIYFCGVKGEHNLLDRTIILAMSYATFAVVNHTMKFAFSEQRPNSGALNSFPSGHTGTAFVGAEFLRREYWHTNKWIGVAGYACAVAVAYMRVYNNRHWINDVVGGAAIGYMSTAFAYWLYPKIFRRRAALHREELLRRIDPEGQGAFTPLQQAPDRSLKCFATPYASTTSAGLSCILTF